MSTVTKNTLNDGTIVNISESLSDEEQEEQEEEEEQEQEEKEEQEDEDEDEEDEDEDKEKEESFIKPINKDIKQTKTKKKNNEELVSLFRENINKFDNSKLDKNKLEILEKDLNTLTDYKYFNNAVELLNAQELNNSFNSNYKYLYPHLDDEFLNIKIANKQEFEENKLIITIEDDFEKQSNEICNKDFELAPHQKFLKNFLSMYTPYNGILLYHGLGTGKTCSAIGVAEETRKYLKFMGYNERIIIVASPNVQENFYLQLFDERKLEEKNGVWTINNCAGQNMLDEINMIQKNLSRDKVIKIVKNIINNYYLFVGYTQFANLILKKSNISNQSLSTLDLKKKQLLIKNKLQKFFGNRLIIIDEIHNIRQSKDNSNKLVSNELIKLVKNVDNLKLLFMSATPMFNDYKEIIFLINILNLNDRRSIIELKDVFASDGSFIVNSSGTQVGLELFTRKINGYISYIKGDNPLSFPFRILPNDFAKTNSILNKKYPEFKINANPLKESLTLFDIYVNDANISPYQEFVYNIILKNNISKFDEEKINAMESFGYTLLQKPLECLNIVFPNSKLENYLNEKMIYYNNNIVEVVQNINIEEINMLVNIKTIVGKSAINNIMTYQESQAPKSRYDYRFKPEFLKTTVTNMFEYNNIGNYSFKIKAIIDSIMGSYGPIIVYSQFIDSGLIPIALALEAVGFTRYGNNKSLFANSPSEELDINTYKKKSELLQFGQRFRGAKYVIISGNSNISPDIVSDLKACTDSNNVDGENVKVILLSAAGSEGLDFKYIRQIHILEPWYNINREEQIIGRAIRTCSHKDLPLNKRNVQIFMHGTLLSNSNESVDLLIYRKAEEKAKIIGNITRVLKEHSIDCYLNYEQQKFDETYLNKKIPIILSNSNTIEFAIGDKSNSPLCDYMANCAYKCKPSLEEYEEKYGESKIDMFSYNESFLKTNNEVIIKLLRDLYKEYYFRTKGEIINYIYTFKEYPMAHIDNALDELVNNENIFISDKYNTQGKLIHIDNVVNDLDDLYIFQPLNLNTDSTLFERSNGIMIKPDALKFALPEDFNIFSEEEKMIDKTKATETKTETETETKTIETKETKATETKTETLKTTITPKIVLSKNDFDDKLIEQNILYVKAIILELERNYNFIITEYTPTKSEFLLKDNKYIYYGKMMDILKEDKVITLSEINTLTIDILLDDLDFNKTVLLVIYLLNNGYNELTNFEKDLLTYYNMRFLEANNGKLKALFIPNKSEFREYTLYILTHTNKETSNITLNSAQSEDYNDFDNIIVSKQTPSLQISVPLGFLSRNKKITKELVTDFKVKTGSNKGARCEQAGKLNSEKIFVALGVKDVIIEKLKGKKLEKGEKLNQKNFCAAQELYFRLYDLRKVETKRWFFNLSEAQINNLL
uniref:Helicase ATP-binding domain-containing protein n=1 Tax=viral metagenome TaxID=1070528 RepID=A0A6C0H4E6_9ZZZZ